MSSQGYPPRPMYPGIRSPSRLSASRMPVSPRNPYFETAKDTIAEQFKPAANSKTLTWISCVIFIIAFIAFIWFAVTIWNRMSSFLPAVISFVVLLIIWIVMLVKFFKNGTNSSQFGFLIIVTIVFFICIIGSYYLSKDGHNGWAWVVGMLPIVLYIIAIILVLLMVIAVRVGGRNVMLF